MKTQVISVVQEKGGAGKTTVLEILASRMVADGARVALIDTDDRKHLFRWADKKKIELDYLKLIDDEKLVPTVRKLREQEYDAILIDTAGYKSAMAIYAIGAADLVLIPSIADEDSALGAVKTYNHVQAVCDSMSKEIPAYVIWTDINPRTNITRDVGEAVAAQGIPMLDVMISSATGFKEMKSLGTGPTHGTALREAKSFMSGLQQQDLLWYYGEGGRWAKSA